MKQVWMLNHYALEPGGAGGTRHFNLAANLPAYGWQATIIAASVELNTGRQRLEPGEHCRLETHAGVPFLWIRTPEYSGNGGGRVMNMLAYTFRVLLPKYTRDLPRPDVIIGSSVHPFAALAGAVLAIRFRVPFIFEVRDLWPQTLIDLGRLRERGPVTWLLRQLERWLYRRASRIVVLLPRAVDYIAPLGIPAENVVWVPNGVDLSAFPITGPRLRQSDDPFVLMYFGAHGQANGLDNVLRAMKLVSERAPLGSIRLRMVGDGPLKPELIKLAGKLGLRDVSFEPPVPKSAVPALAAEADAFVIAVLNIPRLYRYGISMNKLFDYLASSRPIIIASSAGNDPIAEAGAGITIPPGEPEALAQAILTLIHLSEEERRHLASRGRRYVEENHSFDRLAGRLAATLDACVGDAR